ncbi:efflux transporter outer membrane subunit [Methylomonas sp. AM2-LC]|uniref:efflux transporter outer membrane subunit n=1 Tax=Methylomonas sp. AM2-LC TaxID=3153301 RepID=UPI00326596D9
MNIRLASRAAGSDKFPMQHLGIIKLTIVLLAVLTGCTLGPDFVQPDPPKVTSYNYTSDPVTTAEAGGISQHFALGDKISADWWQLFNSTPLNSIVKAAIANNLGLQAAQANLRQSQATLQAGYGIFFPQIDMGFTPSRKRFSAAQFGQTSKPTIFNLYTISSTVSYTLDVFGGERRRIESLKAQQELQGYTAHATYLTLTGNVINSIITSAAYSAEIDATQQLIDNIHKQIDITVIQVQTGTVPYLTLLSLRSQLAALAATLPPLQQKLDQSAHLQASLMGKVPAEWQAPPIKLEELKLPAKMPVTLPSDLINQRPDILSAAAQLHSDSAKIGVATASLFPTISLSASYGYNNTSLADLFISHGNIWAMAGNFAQPLFHGGTIWFNRKAAIETYESSLANYRQTVISAFQQVADTLKALEHDAATQAAQWDALQSSNASLALINANYQAGLVNYLQVLTVNSQYQQARIAYLQILAQRFQDSVALFIALGGEWNTTTPSALENNPDNKQLSNDDTAAP